jgi:putative zinc finger/helix-turn-helix YgiT family protein
MSELCEACHAAHLSVIRREFKFEHAGKELSALEEVSRCAACGHESYVGDQISAHEMAVASAIRKSDGLLTAEELRSVRVKYRFRQTDMEQMLSTGPKTWTRWERGKIPQSKAADTLIRLIASDPDVARHLMELAQVENAEATEVFRQIEERAKSLTRDAMRATLSEQRASYTSEQLADRVADTAFATVRESQRKAASEAIAA